MSPISCDRTRALISSSLDGPLHELERRFLDVHVRRCADCRSFAQSATWFTNLIRTAPPEPAPPIVVSLPPGRVNFRSIASIASVAAVLVLGVNVSLMAAPTHDTSERALVAASLSPDLVSVEESLRSPIRAEGEVGQRAHVPARANRSIGAVKPMLPPSG